MELLQIATAFLLTSSTRFNTSYERYYKVRWLLQTATVPLGQNIQLGPPHSGGDSHMKGAGMFVVLLRGVNFGFWSH